MIIFILTGCAGFETITLNTEGGKSIYSTENALDKGNYQVNINTPKLTDGVFEDFSNELSGWWTFGDIIKYSREKNALRLDVNKPTAGYPQVGFTFPAQDFTGTPVLKIRMKATGSSSPRVRVDLKDVNDMQTNAMPAMNDIELSEDYKDYYFDLNDKWRMSWPEAGIVDPRQIVGLVFFINPGDKPFQGTIFVDEIYVMANKDGSGQISREKVIDEFAGDINWWWGCDKEKVILSKQGTSALKVQFDKGLWSCFGVSFESPMNVFETPVIKVRARATTTGSMQSVDFIPQFTDVANKTNNKYQEEMVQKMIVGTDYMDYFFDFRGKLEPKEGIFNPGEVNSLIVFVNTQGSSAFDGNIIVDEVTLVPSVPDYVHSQVRLSKGTFIDASWPKGQDAISASAFFNPESWKAGDKLSLSVQKTEVKISASGAGPDWESVLWETPEFNMITKPVIKIRVKADGNLSPYLRIVLTDNFGNSANGRPAEKIIEAGKDYTDYYFDFTGRFEQRFPEIKNINPGAIRKLTMYINGGSDPYSGSLTISEIQLISITEYLRVAK